MGFLQADIPPVGPEKFESIPTFERMKLLAQHWVDFGFGAPKIMHCLYLIKGLFFFLGGWLIIGLTTPGLPLRRMDTQLALATCHVPGGVVLSRGDGASPR